MPKKLSALLKSLAGGLAESSSESDSKPAGECCTGRPEGGLRLESP